MRNFFSQNPHPKNTHFLLAVFALVGFLLSGERALAAGLDDAQCKANYGNLSACKDAPGLIDTGVSCNNGSNCFAHSFDLNTLTGTDECAGQGGTCFSGGTANGCTDSVKSDALGVCDLLGPTNGMCCRKPIAVATQPCDTSVNKCFATDNTKTNSVCPDVKYPTQLVGKTCPTTSAPNCCSPTGVMPVGGPGLTATPVGGPGSTTTPTTGGGTQSIAFENPLQYNTVQDVFGGLLSALRGVLIILALIFIVIGALLYITSAGDQKQISTAKAAIAAALIGLAIAIAAPSFLKEISSILNWNSSVPDVANSLSLSGILLKVLNFLLGIIGTLALIMLIIGALTMVSSAGNEKQIDGGKSMVKYALYGIAIAFASLILIKQIAAFFVGA
jgi:hypothetical protein